VCVCVCVCRAVVGVDNKPHKMHGKYIKILETVLKRRLQKAHTA